MPAVPSSARRPQILPHFQEEPFSPAGKPHDHDAQPVLCTVGKGMRDASRPHTSSPAASSCSSNGTFTETAAVNSATWPDLGHRHRTQGLPSRAHYDMTMPAPRTCSARTTIPPDAGPITDVR
jgi:hypothetical protein